jgi:hypothetical protein
VPELAGVDPQYVMGFLYPYEDEAAAACAENRDKHGHLVYGPIRTEAGWAEVLDLRPAIAAARARHWIGSST